MDPKKVLYVSERLLGMGCYEISLGDTIGVGNAGSTATLLDALLRSIPADKLAVHFHDTYGQVSRLGVVDVDLEQVEVVVTYFNYCTDFFVECF